LGCRVKMGKEIDGLVIKIPSMIIKLQSSDFSNKGSFLRVQVSMVSLWGWIDGLINRLFSNEKRKHPTSGSFGSHFLSQQNKDKKHKVFIKLQCCKYG